MTISLRINILIFACFISGCAGSSLSRSAALDLHQELGQSRVIERFPEEYRSFITTIARAETAAERGDLLQSENIYRLAILKGHLLVTRAAESDTTDASLPQKFAHVDPISESLPTLSNRYPSPGMEMPTAASREEASPSLLVLPHPELPEPSSGLRPMVLPATQPLSPLEPAPASKIAHVALPHGEPDNSPLSLLPGDEFPTADMRRFIGNRGYYTTKKGDTLKGVGARLGVDWRKLSRINALDPKLPLKSGQVIVYDNRKIVPSALRDGIVINIADRTLYLLKNGAVQCSYPVALGKPPKPEDDEDWSTPTGRFVITAKTKDPVWKVPQSIQDEMEQRGKEPIKEMPAGKGNPLGKYAMKTSLSGIVIHSTNAPSSIYSYASHGCIRVMPEHMEKLFPVIEPHTSGMIVYQPVKLAVSSEGKLFLEVNRDVYGRFPGELESEVRKLVTRRKVEARVDWNKVAELLKKKSGIPEEITRDPADTLRPRAAGMVKSVTSIPFSGRRGVEPSKPTL